MCLMHPDILASASSWWVSHDSHNKCHKSMRKSTAGSCMFYLSELQACTEANNPHQSFPSSLRAGVSSAALAAVKGQHNLWQHSHTQVVTDISPSPMALLCIMTMKMMNRKLFSDSAATKQNQILPNLVFAFDVM